MSSTCNNSLQLIGACQTTFCHLPAGGNFHNEASSTLVEEDIAGDIAMLLNKQELY